MKFQDTDEERAFRENLRGWLTVNKPTEPLPDDDEARERYLADWHNRLFRGGWLALSWDENLGGRGLADSYEGIVDEEIARAAAPAKPAVVGYLGRAIAEFGDEDIRRRFLPGLLDGTERWCEGFSEPGAGSDLASLRTRGTLHGDTFLVNGHKIWTSDALFADWCLLLLRTEPDLPKHRGISALIVDMASPGVTVEPIQLITGKREFCEVFFDDVEVPKEHLVGRPGEGWAFAMRTLAYERGPGDLGFTADFARDLTRLEAFASEHELSPSLRSRIAQCFVNLEVLRLHTAASLSERCSGEPPGPETSIGKLLMTRVQQDLQRTAIDVYGAPAVLGDNEGALENYLFSRAQSIMGGTEQIQKNIVAQRVLGMPRSE